jgi:hypothetical protein
LVPCGSGWCSQRCGECAHSFFRVKVIGLMIQSSYFCQIAKWWSLGGKGHCWNGNWSLELGGSMVVWSDGNTAITPKHNHFQECNVNVTFFCFLVYCIFWPMFLFSVCSLYKFVTLWSLKFKQALSLFMCCFTHYWRLIVVGWVGGQTSHKLETLVDSGESTITLTVCITYPSRTSVTSTTDRSALTQWHKLDGIVTAAS